MTTPSAHHNPPIRPSAVTVSWLAHGWNVTYSVPTTIYGARLLYRIVRSVYPARVASEVVRDLLANPVGSAFEFDAGTGRVTLATNA